MAWCTAKELWNIRRRGLRVFLGMGKLTLDLWEDELRKSVALLVYPDVDTPVIRNNGVCA